MLNPIKSFLEKRSPATLPSEERARRRSSERALVRRAFEIAICVAIAILVYVFTADITEAAFLQAISGFCGLMIGFQAQYFFQNLHSESRVRALQDDLEELKEEIDSQGAKTHRTVELHERMGRIQDSLRTELQFKRLADFNDLLRNVDLQKNASPPLLEHIEWKERRIITYAMGQLEKLATGTVEIDDIDRELITNSQFLLTLAKDRVRAISFQDEAFWDSPEGKSFLEAHVNAVARGLRITRIFVLTGTPTAPTVATIRKQVDLGVEVFVYQASTIDLTQIEDFVIYDSAFVRLGLLPQIGPFESDRQTNPGLSKFAKLTNNQDEVQRYEYRFEALRMRAHSAADWLDRHMDGVGVAEAGGGVA